MSFKVVSTGTHPIVVDREGFVKLGVEFIEKPAPTEGAVISLARDADAAIVFTEPFTNTILLNIQEIVNQTCIIFGDIPFIQLL